MSVEEGQKSFLIKYNVSVETIDISVQLSENFHVALVLLSIAKFSKLFCWATWIINRPHMGLIGELYTS